MIALEYHLQLLEPLLVSGLLGEPNSAISYPHIPGSQIRGALIGEYSRSRKGDEEDFRRLFFTEDIRYLNAYPEDSAGRRMLPTPRSWFTLKREKGRIFDRANKEPQTGDPRDPQQKLKEVSAEFCSLSSSGEVELLSPVRQINVHTQRDPKLGRATRDKGAVFRYNALAPGQCFVGVILFDTADPSSSDVIKGLLDEGDLWIGGSRSAGYGHVHVDRVRVVEAWQEVEDQQALHDVPAGRKFTVTLLSDALLRDPCTGHFSNDPIPEIAEVLGVAREDLHIENRFWSTSLVGGFNRKWGLPLPQAVALAPGSVFVFKTTKKIGKERERFQRLVERGIGERRIEGFGRITIDWHKRQEYPYPNEVENAQVAKTPDPTGGAVPLTGESKDIAEMMITRMFRARLDRWLVAEVNRTAIDNRPSNSQLSQLRLVAREAMQQGASLQLIKKHLDNSLKRKTAREQFEGAYVRWGNGGKRQRLDYWIYDLPNKADELLHELHPPEIGGVTLDQSKLEELAREYTLRLLDGVLHKATRSSRARTGSEGAE